MVDATAITYAELIRRVPVWLLAQNSALTTEMPNVVQQAQQMILGRLDHDQFETVVTGKTVGNNVVNLAGTDDVLDMSVTPTGVLELRAVEIAYRGTGFVPLEKREVSFLTMLYPRRRPAQPRFYANANGTLKMQVFPYPDRLYALQVRANVAPAVLSDSNQTNVYTDRCPRALEKACFYHAAVFMKQFDKAAAYEKELETALLESNLQLARRRRDETATRPRETANAQGS